MQWKHASSPPPEKFRAVKSAGKVLLTVFFDVQGPLLVEFPEHRKNINSDTVRHFDAYAGPSRTKDRGCSRRVWLCSMITRVHTSPESCKWNWTNSNGRRWSIRPTVRTCRPAISMCLVH
ncbi:hypothetical protein TNCV_1879851 [Trichonephila clavipes]|nr:hypothetical protein TNCV_1879851 [Trichonephila clavipes]